MVRIEFVPDAVRRMEMIMESVFPTIDRYYYHHTTTYSLTRQHRLNQPSPCSIETPPSIIDTSPSTITHSTIKQDSNTHIE